jgi:hypothetical protein
MHLPESRAAGNRRSIWIAVFAAALWLSLVNAGAAFAGGEHWSQGQSKSQDHGSTDWQHSEGHSGSWGGTTNEGHPPPAPPGQENGPCNEEGHGQPGGPPSETPPGYETPPVETPPVETPPVETPPEEKPPVEKPPGHETPPVEKPPGHETPPVEKPPVQTPPVTTPPPVQTPPVQTPPVYTPPTVTPETPTTPPKTESPKGPGKKGGGGVEVLPQEQTHGGGLTAPTSGVTEAGVNAAPAAGTLPFTGGPAPLPLLVLLGGGLVGLGVGLRRVSTERD